MSALRIILLLVCLGMADGQWRMANGATNVGPVNIGGKRVMSIVPGAQSLLTYYLGTNLAARTVGYTNALLAREYFEQGGPDWYQYNNRLINYAARWNTNCWLWGVKGMSATCAGYIGPMTNGGLVNMITMLSPRHFITAAHIVPNGFTRGTNSALFVATNNDAYYPNCLGAVVVGDSDICIGVLDANMPAEVGFVPVLPLNYTAWTGTNALPAFGVNQDLMSYAVETSVGTNGYLNAFTMLPKSYGPYLVSTNWGIWDGHEIDVAMSGDSGDPTRVLIGNQAVLVGCYYGPGGGPSPTFYIDQVNAAMHFLSTNYDLGSDYKLTFADLSQWPLIP